LGGTIGAMSAPNKQTPKPKAKPRTDWDAVERDYRTAKFTLRELAEKYGISHAAIGKKSRDRSWQQDLSDAIRQATNVRLTAELVSSEVSKSFQEVSSVVAVAAEVNTQVIRGHRAGLMRITNIKTLLLDQIEQAAANMAELSEIIEMVRNPDESGRDRANDLLRAAMERGALVDDLKKLAEVDERVRKGEREAFNLNDPKADDDNASAAGPSMTDAERAVRLSRFINGNPAALAAMMAMKSKVDAA
jgi:hypothetical protein